MGRVEATIISSSDIPKHGFSLRARDYLDLPLKEGEKVVYVPYHAHGDINHVDCEEGTVSSTKHLGTGEEIVYVNFPGCPSCAKGCRRDQLKRIL